MRPAEMRISIALSAAFLTQMAIALIWAGAAGERLTQVESRASEIRQFTDRTARLEEQVWYMRAVLERIEEKIDSASVEK